MSAYAFRCTRTRREETRGLVPAEPMKSAARIVHVYVSVGVSNRLATPLNDSAESTVVGCSAGSPLGPGSFQKNRAEFGRRIDVPTGEASPFWRKTGSLGLDSSAPYRSTVRSVLAPPILKGRPVGGPRGPRSLGTVHLAISRAFLPIPKVGDPLAANRARIRVPSTARATARAPSPATPTPGSCARLKAACFRAENEDSR